MIEEVINAAKAAGSILIETADSGLEISRKSSHELVTNADMLSEEFLRTSLGRIEHHAGFLGEESSGDKPPDPPFWIVDPLDGTNNYSHGYPAFSVSIAYWNGMDISLGCVYDPLRDECFHATSGSGAWMNDRRIRCTKRKELSECLIATGFPYHRKENDLGVDLSDLEFFLGRAQGIRRGGSAALDLAYVACGRLDGFWEEHLKPWDMAAGSLIVREAGGRVSAYCGGGWTPGSGGIVASGSEIHPLMLEGIGRKDRR